MSKTITKEELAALQEQFGATVKAISNPSPINLDRSKPSYSDEIIKDLKRKYDAYDRALAELKKQVLEVNTKPDPVDFGPIQKQIDEIANSEKKEDKSKIRVDGISTLLRHAQALIDIQKQQHKDIIKQLAEHAKSLSSIKFDSTPLVDALKELKPEPEKPRGSYKFVIERDSRGLITSIDASQEVK